MSTSCVRESTHRDRFVVVSNPNDASYSTQMEIVGTVVDILGIRDVRPKRLKPPSLEDRVEPIVFLADVKRILESFIQQKKLSEELIDQANHVMKTLYEEQTSLETFFSVAGESLRRCIKNEIPIWWKVYEEDEEPVLFLESLIYGPRRPIPPVQRVIDALKKYFLIEKISRATKNKIFDFIAEINSSKPLLLPPLTKEEKAAGIKDRGFKSFDEVVSWYAQLMELEQSAKSSLEQVCLQNKLEIIFTLNGIRMRFGSGQISSAHLAEFERGIYEMLLTPAYFLKLSDGDYEALLNLIEIDLAAILALEKEDFEMI